MFKDPGNMQVENGVAYKEKIYHNYRYPYSTFAISKALPQALHHEKLSGLPGFKQRRILFTNN